MSSKGRQTRGGRKGAASRGKWLFFFYSVPSRPVANRVKVWRKLSKVGALQMKASVYALPYSEEHYEFLKWLTGDVEAMGGDAVYLSACNAENMTDEEMVALFNAQRSEEYRALDKEFLRIEGVLGSERKGSRIQGPKALSARLRSLVRDFQEVRRVDFFGSEAGKLFGRRLDMIMSGFEAVLGQGHERKKAAVKAARAADYQGRLWVTRPRPFVDRLASAWLIRNFIDAKAEFGFVKEGDTKGLPVGAVTFDMKGGDFTHGPDTCTFESLLASFNLRQRPLRGIARIVHELDLHDGKYQDPETRGVEEVLEGIRKTADTDAEMLDRGMMVFGMLYAARAQGGATTS